MPHVCVAVVGFVLPLLFLIPWILQHPGAYADQVRRYQLYDPKQVSAARGLSRLLSFASLTQRSEIYWQSFNPSFLFFSGDSSLTNATRQAGIFLLPVAVFLAVGIVRLLNRRLPRFNLVILFGFLSAPLGVVLVGEIYASRQLVMVPFAILAATLGVDWFVSAPKKAWRTIGVCLLALIPIQFVYYYRDYFTDYRLRSNSWFEYNLGGALEQVIARNDRAHAPAIYLSSEISWIDSYWRFYLVKHGREDLLQRTTYFEAAKLLVQTMPAPSILLSRVGEATVETLTKTGQLRKVDVVKEPDNTASFAIYER